MLDEKDLQALSDMLDAKIERSQSRMLADIDVKIEQSQSQVFAYIEQNVMPKFEILAEGHETLLETLAPKSRVEALEEEVSFLRQVVKVITQDVAELKKAQ